MPTTFPRSRWARNASARPFACPPGAKSASGISSTVTTLEVTRKVLMISAATVSSRRVPAIRPSGRSSVSPSRPRTSGITDTPVSNPDRPSASSGNTISAIPTISSGSG